MNDREVDLIRERSDSAKLEIRPLQADRAQLYEDFFKFLHAIDSRSPGHNSRAIRSRL